MNGCDCMVGALGDEAGRGRFAPVDRGTPILSASTMASRAVSSEFAAVFYG